MSDLNAESEIPITDDDCWRCHNEPGQIFLCGDDGFLGENCFRELSGIPDEIESQELHDGINDGSIAGYVEQAKDRLYNEPWDEEEE